MPALFNCVASVSSFAPLGTHGLPWLLRLRRVQPRIAVATFASMSSSAKRIQTPNRLVRDPVLFSAPCPSRPGPTQSPIIPGVRNEKKREKKKLVLSLSPSSWETSFFSDRFVHVRPRRQADRTGRFAALHLIRLGVVLPRLADTRVLGSSASALVFPACPPPLLGLGLPFGAPSSPNLQELYRTRPSISS